MFKIKMPPNSIYLFGQLIDVATFDILPTDDWFPIIFNLPETGAIDESFEEVDFGSTLLLLNLGTLFIVGVSIVLSFIFYYIAKATENMCKLSKTIGNYLFIGLFWNSLIDYCMSSYIELAFAVVINFY
jgi:hypothetical protein